MESITILIIICIVSLLIYLRINRAKILGAWGEKKVSMVLSMLGNDYKVFKDVLIKK